MTEKIIKKGSLIEINRTLACVISSTLYNKTTEMLIALPLTILEDEIYQRLDDSYGFLIKDKTTDLKTVIRCNLPKSFEVKDCIFINTIPEKIVDDAINRFKTIVEE